MNTDTKIKTIQQQKIEQLAFFGGIHGKALRLAIIHRKSPELSNKELAKFLKAPVTSVYIYKRQLKKAGFVFYDDLKYELEQLGGQGKGAFYE